MTALSWTMSVTNEARLKIVGEAHMAMTEREGWERAFRFRPAEEEFAVWSAGEIERLERTQEAVDVELYRAARALVLRKLGGAVPPSEGNEGGER
jgi:hypothetical protein